MSKLAILGLCFALWRNFCNYLVHFFVWMWSLNLRFHLLNISCTARKNFLSCNNLSRKRSYFRGGVKFHTDRASHIKQFSKICFYQTVAFSYFSFAYTELMNSLKWTDADNANIFCGQPWVSVCLIKIFVNCNLQYIFNHEVASARI